MSLLYFIIDIVELRNKLGEWSIITLKDVVNQVCGRVCRELFDMAQLYRIVLLDYLGNLENCVNVVLDLLI